MFKFMLIASLFFTASMSESEPDFYKDRVKAYRICAKRADKHFSVCMKRAASPNCRRSQRPRTPLWVNYHFLFTYRYLTWSFQLLEEFRIRHQSLRHDLPKRQSRMHNALSMCRSHGQDFDSWSWGALSKMLEDCEAKAASMLHTRNASEQVEDLEDLRSGGKA